MFNPATIRELVTAALRAGVLAGLLLTAAQQIRVIPNLFQTEVYEGSAAATIVANLGNGHAAHDWHPEYLERTFFNTIANISLGVGFALLLGSIMCLCGRPGCWRTGLLWGLAGYITFFAAPSLGLPLEIPGTEAAKLADRQSWWLIAALDTGFGLSLLAFATTGANKFFGAVLLAAPHLINTPQPEAHSNAAPTELTQFFIVATVFANAVFWLALGGLMGHFYKNKS
jgi:cobalt transporter subunit CbtA